MKTALSMKGNQAGRFDRQGPIWSRRFLCRWADRLAKGSAPMSRYVQALCLPSKEVRTAAQAATGVAASSHARAEGDTNKRTRMARAAKSRAHRNETEKETKPMKGRRAFLKEASALTLLSSFSPISVRSEAAAITPAQAPTPAKSREPLGWKPHPIKQGDGRGGWIVRSGEYQFLVRQNVGVYLFPYGLAQMDDGEIMLAAAWTDGKEKGIESWELVVAFSRDAGKTWTEMEAIPDGRGRPTVTTYLGKGNLVLESELGPKQYFSSDYGRTWPERKPLQPSSKGETVNGEGNTLVESAVGGESVRMTEIGYFYPKGSKWPTDPAVGILRWSSDGGRTWVNEIAPKEWRWEEEYQGKTYTRGTNEGSLVRAANGWIVAALRTDMPARYLDAPNNDSLEGTGVSISRDDGVTWSPIQVLYDAGRHHAHLLKLPNGDLLMVLIVRVDIQGGRLASYRRGLEAIISHDNGLTWDLAHKYVLDDYEFYDGAEWFNGECGHCCTTLLDNGLVLSAYAKYLTKGTSLILWKPASS